MSKKKIVISEYNVSGLRLRPFNLLWGGPLLVKDRKSRQKRQEQESNTQPPSVLEAPPAAEEAQAEAPPPADPVIPVEPDTPAAGTVKNEADTKSKEKKKHKKHHPKQYYEIESDSDSSSRGRRYSSYRRSQCYQSRPIGCHRDGCQCSHDAETEKRETKHRKQSLKAMRCPVCKQHVDMSSTEDDDSSIDCSSDATTTYVCKRDKKKNRSKAKSGTLKNESGGNTEKQRIKDGNTKEDEPQVPSSATALTDGDVVADPKAQNEVDEGNAGNAGNADQSNGTVGGDSVVVESNVMPTLQDATNPLPGVDLRADFLASSGAYPSQFPPSFHRSDHNVPSYLPEFADTQSRPYPYPSYPAYAYGYCPYPMCPYPHMTPPMAGYLQPHLPLISPYASAGAEFVPDADMQGNRGEAAVADANAQNDGGNGSAPWHDKELTTGYNMNKAEGEDETAETSNDQIDNWGIKWDDSGLDETCVGTTNNGSWSCKPADTEGSADRSPTWTASDLALLGRLHTQQVTDRWRDLQTAFYNETGRMVDLEVLKSTAENTDDGQ